MLKLVLGGSGSGKTTLLYARIKARAEAGQRSILLVPEQFTSSTEGRIYRELGDALSGMVDSYSFTSLAEHILSAEGGAAVQTLSDAGRAVLVRRTLEELQDTVQYYYRHRRSAAFCQMAAETIDELKSAGLSGQQLYRLAQGCGSGSGKPRFFVKPNLMQCVSKDYPTSFVITDPKGSLIGEVGQLLVRCGYRVKVLNTINFSKSMRYNPFRYIHSEKDILKLVNTLICNTKGEGEKSAEDFWIKSERLLYSALIGMTLVPLLSGLLG